MDSTRTTTRWVVALTGIGSLMAALDTLVVSTALTTLRADLGASVQQLEWVVNAYNLTFAVLLITAAALGDRYGRRRLFAGGLLLFAAASAACALAPNVETLIGARAVQGAGAALIIPLGLALLSEAFPPERRGAAIGIFSAITGLAVAAGPLVGGAVVEGLSWHWIFWLNVPIGVVAAPLAIRKMRESYGPRTAIDVTGLLLVSGGAFGVVWGLVRGNQSGWGSPEVVTSLVAGVVLLGAFVRWQLQTATPMLPPRLFRSRAFTAGNAAIFLTFASLFTGVFFFAQLLQVVLGHDALGAGLRLLPWTATFITVAPVAGALADRIGERLLLSVGLALAGRGLPVAGRRRRPGPDLRPAGRAVRARRRRSLDGHPVRPERGGRRRGQRVDRRGCRREQHDARARRRLRHRRHGRGVRRQRRLWQRARIPGRLPARDRHRGGIRTGRGAVRSRGACSATPRRGPARPGARVMRRVMVRYQVHPDRVEENIALVRAVYAELAALRRQGSATRRTSATTA